jgi:hypothetical protein
MKAEQTRWTEAGGWAPALPGKLGDSAQVLFLFGSTRMLRQEQELKNLLAAYPRAHMFGCSTAGEICGTEVSDDTLVATAIHFDHTRIEASSLPISRAEDSFETGRKLTASLCKDDLAHVFVLSEGLAINGTSLVRGLMSELPEGVTVTGGLAGDGERFQETLVLRDGVPLRNTIGMLAFYGKRLKVGYGSLGGWDPFGPERRITRSKGNVLYELDGKSALELYRQYLGNYADGLPATGLLFPLSLRTAEGETAVVRTVLAIDDSDKSMTFAGDLPEGAYARLMKANFDRLIDGAVGAARTSLTGTSADRPSVALLISCVGRKMVLRQRIEEEVEGVRDVLGAATLLAGFYSYGEISPFTPSARCELHNQTMTITTLSEE